MTEKLEPPLAKVFRVFRHWLYLGFSDCEILFILIGRAAVSGGGIQRPDNGGKYIIHWLGGEPRRFDYRRLCRWAERG
jgi:hypothetical protein